MLFLKLSVRVDRSYRDDELQVLISSGQMIPAEEEPQPITCFCILDQRGRGIPQLWRSCDHISSSVTRLPCLSFPPRQRRLLEEPTHHSTLTASAHSVSECTKEAPWTRLILNMQDMFSFLKKDLNIVTQQDAVTEKQHNRLIIFCDGDIPQQLFSDTLRTEDCWTSPGDSAGQVTDNASHWSLLPDNNNNNSEGIQHELVSRDDFNTCKPKSLLKSCQIHAAPGGLSEGDGAVKRRKSVSFDDDVMVYLFDQVLLSSWLFICSMAGLVLCFLVSRFNFRWLSTITALRRVPPWSCTLGAAHLRQAAIPATCQTSH